MSISMEAVAQQAGVSKSTVSLVLNNRPGASAKMRQRVLDAAAAVGYQLPGQRTTEATERVTNPPVIALVHCVGEKPDIDPGLTHLYLSYRNGIQRFTQGRDISVMLMTSYQDGNAASLSYQLLAQQQAMIDGLILMGPGLRRDSDLIRRVLDEQIPAVILGRSWPDLPISSVSQDHAEQADMILRHLIELGHTKIGFVAREVDRNYDWFYWRATAYRKLMAQRFQIDDDRYVAIGDNLDAAVMQLLVEKPEVTALFALNDHIAYQAMRAAVGIGRKIPTDLSIASIDGVIKPSDGLPTLTTVAFPHEEVGYLAAELIIKQLENKHLRTAQLTVRSTLQHGGSCAVLNQ